MKIITSFFMLISMLSIGVNLRAQSSSGTIDVQVFTNPDIGSVAVDRVLMENAPHLPWMQRTESTEQVFKGQRFNYELESNRSKILQWVSEYPAELQAYQEKIPAFFKEFPADTFKGQEQDFYYDIKAQYELIAQLLNWN